MKKAKKILIITESINVEDSSGSKANVDIIKNLKRSGYDVKVYHYTRKSIKLKGMDCIAIPEQKATLFYVLSKIILVFFRLTKININPFIEKRLGFSFAFFNDVFSIKKGLKKETNFNPDWVITLSKAASFRVHKALLKLPHWHSKWLAYIHDPYPMHFYPRPYNWVEPGYYQKQEFFREVSKKSAHAIFPSQLLMEWMGSYYPDFLERGIVIPHQISNGAKINQNAPAYFKKDYFTILHAGSLMKPRNPSGLVEGFQQFLSTNPQAKANSQLLILGKKDFFDDYLNAKQSEIQQLYLSSGYVSFDDVQCMQNETSVNVILEAKSEISPFLPGKFPHCVKANKPILYLGPKQSECLRLLGEPYSYAAEIDEVNSIAKHIEQMYINWKNQSEQQFLNRPDLEVYLSYNNLKETIENLNA
ncbi:MAG: UDP-glycosyltransferase [Flavobacteriaceae bacterium]|nr:UDP-glycosyltransferase [Flavobacteriaceae bacterium]